ncbi:hypothetical protein FA09DRAFT_168208 [Tilletiopsis washingtonensis]|jgi:hypothetical protein|uniref:Uncharacterized protein n=1 Tax=Tilletiopsis washingtonensis TaxID=58919 RepID=A0A316Z0E9_9BASI|nr:hypothetical protein FA09DRAFT_168208 [Tilletiopsis washingtonensis]PWN94776.1 hypothetical protein FA09DRAFT_168208 [Tilletiopsis washingtonensis]
MSRWCCASPQSPHRRLGHGAQHSEASQGSRQVHNRSRRRHTACVAASSSSAGVGSRPSETFAAARRPLSVPRCTPQGPGQPRSRAKRGLYQALAAPAARPRHDSGCGRCLERTVCPSRPSAPRARTRYEEPQWRHMLLPEKPASVPARQRQSGSMTSEPFVKPACRTSEATPRHRQGCTARLARAGPCRRKGAACASRRERAVGAPSFPRFRRVRGAQVRASEAGAVQPALLRHAPRRFSSQRGWRLAESGSVSAAPAICLTKLAVPLCFRRGECGDLGPSPGMFRGPSAPGRTFRSSPAPLGRVAFTCGLLRGRGKCFSSAQCLLKTP